MWERLTARCRAGMMYKRAQGKSVLGVTNWKARFFVLTTESLTYWDHQASVVHASAKQKGVVPIASVRVSELYCFPVIFDCFSVPQIKAVEPVDAEAFQRPFLFQIIHENVLYVQTLSQTDLEEWMSILRECISHNSVLHHKYHPGMFDGDVWTCCREAHKDYVGCTPAFPYRCACVIS